MMAGCKPKILIVEDAVGVATLYRELLDDTYDITISHNGKQAQSLIDAGSKFDLAIVDMVLPPEDLDKFRLADCHKTGLRLLKSMLNNNVCSRFYVITVFKDLEGEVEELCKEHNAVFKFEHKLDNEPEELVGNVRTLLQTHPN